MAGCLKLMFVFSRLGPAGSPAVAGFDVHLLSFGNHQGIYAFKYQMWETQKQRDQSIAEKQSHDLQILIFSLQSL